MGTKSNSIGENRDREKTNSYLSGDVYDFFNNLKNSTICEWEFKICATQSEIVDTNANYDYQPGGLYITHEDGFFSLVSHTPQRENGINLSQKTDLTDAECVSDDFYYHVYELISMWDNGEKITKKDIDHKTEQVNVSERYHLQEVLYNLFNEDENPGVYTKLLIEKSISKMTTGKYIY